MDKKVWPVIARARSLVSGYVYMCIFFVHVCGAYSECTHQTFDIIAVLLVLRTAFDMLAPHQERQEVSFSLVIRVVYVWDALRLHAYSYTQTRTR